ncbi:DoxX family protein [Spirosoma sp. KNUC1025]|uniref:DoxX family protein n=1 Tax=Spirosoma sp. KNUC1025 TaxID=2894082 RepID=UPI003866B327|nr:DoxX family protein [Spirosoma sp. KNUC1025]
MPNVESAQSPAWSRAERTAFRFAFLYFLIQAVPLSGRFYHDLFTIDWGAFYYRDLFDLSHYAPHFFGPVDTFANWAVVAIIALVGTIVWTLRDQKRTNYPELYYWLRVVLRYRLAIGIIAYGFIKLFPLQAPLPSISNLNTPYGDFTAWKLFSLSLGIVPSYESFLGLVEILGGLLLLNRKTTSIGTLIIIPFLGNVFMSNLAYEGGEYVYSFLLITFALFLFAYDAVRLFRLVSLEQPAAPNRFKPVLTEAWQRYGRLALKSAFLFFAVFLYGYKTYAAYKTGPYQFPKTPGLTGAAGLYDVAEFKLADKTLPYSKTDSVRWQDVVFETWNTISIKSNRPVILDRTNTEQIHTADTDRTYEQAGSAGRHYYSYQIDSAQHVLTLKNRNPNYPNETLRLHYDQSGGRQITLSGLNENRDSVYVVLHKLNKKYLLNEAAKAGRRGTLKL